MPLGISFIIPHRKEEKVDDKAVKIARFCDQLGIDYEFFLVEGNHPTFQRNRCIEKTTKTFLYFLDNDSSIEKTTLEVVAKRLMKENDVQILGGPSLLRANASPLENAIQSLFSTPLAIGPSVSRYTSIGHYRDANDQELILCNLIIQKKVFDEVGLLDEQLYPNEENAFISRAKKKGMIVRYDPEMIVRRPHRESFTKFIKQIHSYGRGRGEQTRLLPSSFMPNLIAPIFFPIYVLSLAPIFFASFVQEALKYIYATPAMLYICLWGYASFTVFLKKKHVDWRYTVLFLLNHLLYGIGFWRGFIFRRHQIRQEVSWNVRHLKKKDLLNNVT